MERIEIRPSTIQSHQLCPARTMLQEHPDFDHIPNEALTFGTLEHWRIAEHLKDPGARVTFNDMIVALEDIFREDAGVELRDIAEPKVVRRVVSEALDAYEAWVSEVLPYLPETGPAVELPMEALLDDDGKRQVWLTGTPDAVYTVEPGAVIYDWKTAGRAWDDKKFEAQIQPLAYRELVANNFEVAGDSSVAFYFGVYDRSGGLWHLHLTDTAHLNERMDAFRQQAVSAALLAESEWPYYTPGGQAFHKTRGWHCSPRYCSAWEACKGKYLINDGNADAEPLTFDEKGWV